MAMTYYKDYFICSSVLFFSRVTKRGKNGCTFINESLSFDIETTSFYEGDKKRAIMYVWGMCVKGNCIYGRTWEEFADCLEILDSMMCLSDNCKCVIYVHNLAYEFQFLIGHVSISEIFAREPHKVMKCTINDNFIFKCSYFLTNSSLEEVAKKVTCEEIAKGKYDYKKIRHFQTPLTNENLEYLRKDVYIIYLYIKELIEEEGAIYKIPLTQTGYVRRYCFEHIKKSCNYSHYRANIKRIAPINPKLFTLLNKAYQGGYTHGNIIHLNQKLKKVKSIDFTSSYPFQMVCEKFPMGKFNPMVINDKEAFYKMINKYACVFAVCFKNVKSKSCWHTLSFSKCDYVENEMIDNGRIVSADILSTYMTDIDFKNFEKFYTFENIAVTDFYFTYYDYLPKPFVECILKFYSDKTVLKDVAGKEKDYLRLKEMLNSSYGMCVTSPVNPDIIFSDGEWIVKHVDMENALKKNYNNHKQFLVYQWGVWVSAWARFHLYEAIEYIGKDVVYSDTDSVKFIHYEKYEKWIEDYNANVCKRLKEVCKERSFDYSLVSPKNSKGEVCTLGLWSDEGVYSSFKTLGAKKYLATKNGKNVITVSGLNKSAVKYMEKQGDIYDFFDYDMYIPAKFTGKMTHTYIDEPFSCALTDYTGNTAIVSEYSYIHLEDQKYQSSIGETLVNYFLYVISVNHNIMTGRYKHPDLAIKEIENI